MRLYKKIIAFALIFTLQLSAQAMGFSIKGLYVKAAGDFVNRNHSGVVLQNGTVLDNIDLKKMTASYDVVAEKSKEIELNNKANDAVGAQTVETSAVVDVNKDKSITSDDIGKAISKVNEAMKGEDGQSLSVNATASLGNTVFAESGITIVLDPGHGGSESGAVAGKYLEKDLNLKIAQYAKEELDTYSGVTVGMTRASDTYLGLAERADIAKQQGANLFVSMHNNSSGTGQMYGSEVFVSVLKAYNETSTALGNIILDQLSALGLYNRGVKVRPSETGTIFTLTGEVADYYSVIKAAAYSGFPGIIIEHSFMDNPTEAQKYLSTDDKLKQLGIADATALAKYYGLVKKPVVPNGWLLENGEWHYYKYGTLMVNSWKSDSHGWCYLDSNGNWTKGVLIKDSIGLCYIGADGYWSSKSTGWKMDSLTNKWAFIGKNGYALKNAWIQDSHGWCYLDSEGYWLDHSGIANDSMGSCIIGNDGYWTGARQ